MSAPAKTKKAPKQAVEKTVEQPAAPPASTKQAGGKRKAAPPAAEPVAEPVVAAVSQKKERPAKKQKTVEQAGQAAPAAQTGGKDKRHFKCIMINSEGNVVCTGRYSGRKPKQAGNKACTRIFKGYADKGLKLPAQIIFGIHECTRNTKKKKKYFYVGTREKLDKPLEIPIKKLDPDTGKNMVIPYNFNNVVKKLTDSDCNEYKLLANYDTKDDDEQEQTGGETRRKTAKARVVKHAKKQVKAKVAKQKPKAKPKAEKPKVEKTKKPVVLDNTANLKVSKKKGRNEQVQQTKAA